MKLYREDQKYHDIIALGLISVLATLLMFTALRGTIEVWKVLIGGAVVGAVFFAVLNLRLKIRIGRNKMSIRVAPLPWMAVKLPKHEVTGVEFIKSTSAELANGWAVHYGGNLRMFNFGDRKGMVIHRKDGKGIVILSRRLFENQDRVLDDLRSHGWDVD